MKHKKETTPKELLTDLRTLVADAETMAANSLSEHTTDALNALRTRYEAAQERFADIYEGARTRVVAGAKSTDAAIRANPYQSLAIAAGVGLLAGVLISRRSR